jgi:hypothetical protein
LAARKKRKSKRTEEINGKPIALRQNAFKSAQWSMNMVHIRMGALPSRASLAGALGPFTLKDNEGMGEETAFLYDPATRVLLSQRNRYGVSANAFGRYLERVANLDNPIILSPIIRRDALDRVARMSVVSKISIGLSGLGNRSAATSANSSLMGALSTIGFYDSPVATLSLSIGRSRGTTLTLARAKQLVANAANAVLGITVDKLEVRGHAPGEPLEVVDLFDFCIVETGSVGLDGTRRAPYAARKAQLESAWNNHRVDLRKMFRNN